MKILVGCEESQEVTKAFRALGHEAYSCDLKRCSGGHPEWHIQMDVFRVINGPGHKSGIVGNHLSQRGDGIFIDKWDMGIFFPDCTYLTCSAEWAYKDGPYHQKVKAGTLTGVKRDQARGQAIEFFFGLWNCGIERIAMENPIGVVSKYMKPSQIINPYQFGDNASKSTCLWLKGLPLLKPTLYVEPRIVNGKKRWDNQTDSGQNKLSPSENRAELRSKTYPGIASAMAEQWGKTTN